MSLQKNPNNEITNSQKNSLKSNEICESLTKCDKINPKKGEISLIEDSTDGLQWCAELDYEYKSDEASSYSVPKSIFEASLLTCSNSYATPPSSNYSNHLDVNLAQIDIETFKSEDINAVFLQQTEEDCDSICSSFRSTHCSDQQNSLLFDSNPSEDINQESIDRINVDKLVPNGANNDISVDSLDMSLFDKNTSKLLQRCTERDKNNYVIAFEGSITGSQEFNAMDHQKRYSLNRSYTKETNGFSSHSRLTNNELKESKMTKSERLSRSSVRRQNERNLNDETNDLVQEIDESICKMTQSIPDIKALLRMNGHYRLPYCPVSGFIPLYDLQSSQSTNSHSSGSEFSPPRSLVKVFMQNRSPFSSQPISPSLSYENRSHDSRESASTTTAESPVRGLYYNILSPTQEANNNTILMENRTTADDQFSNNDNSSKSRMRSDCHRFSFDSKQTFPIKEVDESMSESSTTDTHMTSSRDTTPTDLNQNPLKGLRMQKTNSNFNYVEDNYFSRNVNDCQSQQHSRLHRSRSNPRTSSTQYQNRLVDKEVQASMASNGQHSVANITPLVTPESPNSCNKPVYVYYPNYSLPDLSFLEQVLEKHSNCGPKTVYLSPTKHQMPEKESVSVRMRGSVKSKSRPKSFNDFETLSKQNFSHIKDWDSLNILLPNEFKELIQKAQNVSKSDQQMANQVLSNDSSNCKVRMRSHRSSGHLADNSFYSRRGYARNKRYSLQEYPFSQINEIETESETNCHNISHTENSQSCLTRSQTMPNCHNSCHCYQHCCHSCCHSCCRTPCQSPSAAAANKSLAQTSHCEVNTNSIDRLCQLLEMDLSFKKLMNIINGQNNLTNGSNIANVNQNKEETNFETLFTQNLNTKSNQDADEEASHFKQLKQRWESLATVSPTKAKSQPRTDLSPTADPKKVHKKSNEIREMRAKPMVARKPQVVLRRPQSSIPRPTSLNTESTHNYRKSMIPVPKAGLRSPASHPPKVKSSFGHKQ